MNPYGHRVTIGDGGMILKNPGLCVTDRTIMCFLTFFLNKSLSALVEAAVLVLVLKMVVVVTIMSVTVEICVSHCSVMVNKMNL